MNNVILLIQFINKLNIIILILNIFVKKKKNTEGLV